MTKYKIRGWINSILEAVVVIALLYCVCWPVAIEGNSMESILHTGDRAVMSRVVARFGELNYGDIVVLRLNENNIENGEVIKRIIGLPSDRVKIEAGKVYINGDIINESYLVDSYTNGDVDIVLESDEYYVLGDNRGVSLDSRKTGAISRRNIIGKVFFKIYPVSEIGII